MRILVLDSALGRCTAAIVHDDAIEAERSEVLARGHASVLPDLARAVMGKSGIDLIGVTVGPGSFSGIRAGLALAHGIGLAAGVPVIGVTVGEAIADAYPNLGRRALWTATGSRRDHVFLERGTSAATWPLDAPPRPDGPVALAGGAATRIAARLASWGCDVMLTDARFPLPRHIAAVARRRHLGALRPLSAQPLYVDPPDAHPPAGGQRPAPAFALL